MVHKLSPVFGQLLRRLDKVREHKIRDKTATNTPWPTSTCIVSDVEMSGVETKLDKKAIYVSVHYVIDHVVIEMHKNFWLQ